MKRSKKKTKNRICAILIILALALIVGCVCFFVLDKLNTKDDSTVSTVTEESNDNAADTKEKENAVKLTEEELNKFQELFNTAEYNGFVLKAFSSPDNINWNEVIFNGAGIAEENISDEEKNEFLKLTGGEEIYTDLIAIKKDKLADYMKAKADVDINDIDLKELDWVYSDKYECFYAEHGDTNFTPFYCVEGSKTGNKYELDFVSSEPTTIGSFTSNPDRILTLEEAKNGYVVKSNVIKWESGNNKDQTFDVDMPQFAGHNCRLITWDGNVDDNVDARILITVDGNYESGITLGTDDNFDETHMHIESVEAIGIFDFNADGNSDIAVIGKTWEGKDQLVLLQCNATSYDDKNYYFSLLTEASNRLQSELKGELSIQNVKATILGESKRETFNSYKDAYKVTARMKSFEDSDVRFSLSYIDNDDVPELIADKPGYSVSVYKFMDGVSIPVMEDWAYGAMGNHGYEYSPNNNCLRNYNTDYAGAILYISYMSIHDHSVNTDFYEKVMNFDDLDGDGSPSDDELAKASDGNFTGSVEYFSESKKLSPSEIEKKISEIENSREFVGIRGELEYNELINSL